jgi:hypothetical protein
MKSKASSEIYLMFLLHIIVLLITAAICLHGYRVQSTGGLSGSKRHAFELIPPDSHQGLKFFYFVAETETERKR